MTLAQSIIIGIVYALVNFSFLASYTTYYRPIVCGTIVGAILGDVTTGAVLGAQINLMTATSTDGDAITDEDMEMSRAIIESRVNALGASEAVV